MPRLIDADALKLEAWPERYTGEGVVYVEDIDNAPTVDAVEVKHGRWVKKQFADDCTTAYRCSDCHTTWDANTNYCPNCGAKMDGDGNG